jgi:hypothetical protein
MQGMRSFQEIDPVHAVEVNLSRDNGHILVGIGHLRQHLEGRVR